MERSEIEQITQTALTSYHVKNFLMFTAARSLDFFQTRSQFKSPDAKVFSPISTPQMTVKIYPLTFKGLI